MQRNTQRNEIELENGDITDIKCGDVWVKILPNQDEENERYEIVDVVTDAVHVKVLDADRADQSTAEPTSPRFDYSVTEFRSDAVNGLLIPESYLSPNNDTITDFTHFQSESSDN